MAAIVVSLLTAANRELVMPKPRQQLLCDARDLQGDVAFEMTPAATATPIFCSMAR